MNECMFDTLLDEISMDQVTAMYINGIMQLAISVIVYLYNAGVCVPCVDTDQMSMWDTKGSDLKHFVKITRNDERVALILNHCICCRDLGNFIWLRIVRTDRITSIKRVFQHHRKQSYRLRYKISRSHYNIVFHIVHLWPVYDHHRETRTIRCGIIRFMLLGLTDRWQQGRAPLALCHIDRA